MYRVSNDIVHSGLTVGKLLTLFSSDRLPKAGKEKKDRT